MITTRQDKISQASERIAELRRLIEALDRRVPHLERLGEAQIARDAADLRERTLGLIRRIEDENQEAGHPPVQVD
jgi:type VI protein secretion system component VasF